MSYIGRGNFTTSTILTLTGLLTAGTLLVNGVANFDGDLVPAANNTHDVGRPTSSWGNMYASGTAIIANVSSTRLSVGTGSAILSVFQSGGSARFQNNVNQILFDAPSGINFQEDSTTIFGARILQSGVGSLVPAGGWYLSIGDAGTYSSHSFNLNEDLQVQGRLEVDGQSFFDGATTTFANAAAATTTAIFGSSNGAACIGFEDTDKAGFTWMTTLNGVATFSTTDCRF